MARESDNALSARQRLPARLPGPCSLGVTVEDDRIVEVRESQANPYTFIDRHVQGFERYMERVRRVTLVDAERITGVPRTEIQTLASWYHALSPAAISVGNGLERNQNGGSAIRAIFALPALAGKLGVPGGGLVNGASLAFPKTMARLQRPDLAPPGTRTLNIVDVGAHLLDPALDPPIMAVFKGGWLRTSDNGQTVSALCPGASRGHRGGGLFQRHARRGRRPPAPTLSSAPESSASGGSLVTLLTDRDGEPSRT
jgi:hypothetical protein